MERIEFTNQEPVNTLIHFSVNALYRITGLLTIFKREFDDSHDKNTTDDTLTIGDKGMDMAKIAKEAEAIFGGPADTTEVDLDGKGGRTFLRVSYRSHPFTRAIQPLLPLQVK